MKILFLLFVQVILVNSECDNYFNCVQSFYDNFFNKNISSNNVTVETVTITNEDFKINDVNSLLGDVSSLLQKELEQKTSALVQNLQNNNTNIFVKSIDVNDDSNDQFSKLFENIEVSDIGDKIIENYPSQRDNANLYVNPTNINEHSNGQFRKFFENIEIPDNGDKTLQNYVLKNNNHNVYIKSININDHSNNQHDKFFENIKNPAINGKTVQNYALKNNTTKIFVKSFNFNEDPNNQFSKLFANINFPDIDDKLLQNDSLKNNKTVVYEKSIINNDLNNQFSKLFENIEISDLDDKILQNYTSDFEKNLQYYTHNVSEMPIKINTVIESKKKIVIPINQTSSLEKVVKENEIVNIDDNLFEMYDFEEDNSTDYPIIDYVELYKDTTNEYIDLNLTGFYNNDTLKEITTEKIESDRNIGDPQTDIKRSSFAWIAAIFIKTGKNDQFDYHCDGAILTATAVITSARCVWRRNKPVKLDEIIIILGKTSLQNVNDDEKIINVKDVITHEKFKVNPSENDIAILLMENAVLSKSVQAARLGYIQEISGSFTTGWASNGDLTIIEFTKDKTKNCVSKYPINAFCAVYGNDVIVCPSYGGLYIAELNNTLYLQGIRIDDPMKREACINEPVNYITLGPYIDWINEVLQKSK